MNDLYIMHYGVGHDKGGHSGRYPWGSGENPYKTLSSSTRKKLIKESKREFDKTNPVAANVSNKLQKYGKGAAILGSGTILLGSGMAFVGAYYNIPYLATLGFEVVGQGATALAAGSGSAIAGKSIKNIKSKNNAQKKYNDAILGLNDSDRTDNGTSKISELKSYTKKAAVIGKASASELMSKGREQASKSIEYGKSWIDDKYSAIITDMTVAGADFDGDKVKIK